MHALGLLLIIAFIIFIVPIIGIFQLILRFFWNVNWKRKIRKLKNLQKRLKSGFMASEL